MRMESLVKKLQNWYVNNFMTAKFRAKIFCLYSGGKKTIACLLAILNDPQYSEFVIQAHYVHHIDYRNDFVVALEKVKKSLSYFQKNFPDRVIVSENQVNFSCLPARSALPNPVDIHLFVARQIVAVDVNLRHVVMGFTHDDLTNPMLSKKIEAHFELLCSDSSIARQVKLLLPLRDTTVDEIISEVSQYIE